MKEKTIVAIRGSGYQGKSTTIRNIATLLEALPGASLIRLVATSDIKVIITIGKIVIGIESQGDPNSRLQESLNDFVSLYKCDIIVCACRTSGSTVHIVENIANNYGYRIIWCANYRSAGNHDALNQLSAEQIVELIKQVMSGVI